MVRSHYNIIGCLLPYGRSHVAGSLATKFVAAPEGYYLSLHVLSD